MEIIIQNKMLNSKISLPEISFGKKKLFGEKYRRIVFEANTTINVSWDGEWFFFQFAVLGFGFWVSIGPIY